MGCAHDTRVRVVKRRIANTKYRDKIAQARSLIYDQGRVVQSTAVEAILKRESYVPTLVSKASRYCQVYNC
jgi:hypothetical protein